MMKNKERLQILMTNIVAIFGKEIITDKRFVSLLADYGAFKGNNNVRRIINAIIAGRYAGLIVNLTSSPLDLSYLKAHARELSRSEGFSEDVIESVMRMLVFACNKANQSVDDYSIIRKEEKYGAINSNGNVIVACEYDKIIEFNSDFGIHLACLKRFDRADVYTIAGDLVYSGGPSIGLTNEKGLWIVEQDNRHGLIHPNGEIVAPFIYRRIFPFNPGKAVKLLVVESETGFGVIDYSGNQVLPAIFESVNNWIDDVFEFIEAKLSDRYIFFNTDGTIADISPLFCTTPLTEEAYNADDHKFTKGYNVGAKQLVISTTKGDITDLYGKIICSLGKFNDGLAVAKDDLWIGYMDTTLQFKIRELSGFSDAKFDFCEPFNNGLAIVGKGMKKGVINIEGKFIASLQYANIIRREWGLILRYEEKPIQTIFNDEYLVGDCFIMWYNKEAEFAYMVNAIYDIGNFQNNKAFVQYRNFVGIIISDGKSFEPIEYEWLKSWNSPKLHEAKGISPVRRNGFWGYLDLEKGFMPFNSETQKRNEKRYIAKHIETSTPIPYFNEYQKENNPCGFKWSNLFHIPVELYLDFMRTSAYMTTEQRLQWLKSNSINPLP